MCIRSHTDWVRNNMGFIEIQKVAEAKFDLIGVLFMKLRGDDRKVRTREEIIVQLRDDKGM